MSDARKCIIQPPTQIRGALQTGGFTALAEGISPFWTGRAATSDTTGTLALHYLGFTTTNGSDFTSAMRSIELALVDGSGKLTGPSSLRFATPQTILFAGTVPTLYIPFTPAWPIPRDIDGPLLQRLRWRVGADPAGFDWTIRIGLAETLLEIR